MESQEKSLKKTTDELKNEIKAATDIDDYLNTNRSQMLSQKLPGYLKQLLAQKKISKAEVIRASSLDKAYVYQIFSGERMPSKDKLIALAFGMSLSDEETQKMLKLSGNRELYARDERDSLILFAIQREKTIFEINELLYAHKLAVLGTMKE